MCTKTIETFLFVIILTFGSITLKADILILTDRTVLNGKIITDEIKTVEFSNTYGTFRIEKKLIREMIITKHYEDDILTMKERGLDVDEEDIKKNFIAGKEIQEKRKKLSPARQDRSYKRNNLSLVVNYSHISGKLKEVLSLGIGGFLLVDYTPDFFFDIESGWFVPGFRIDLGGIYFHGKSCNVTSYFAGLGPLWVLPLNDYFKGSLFLSIPVEITYLLASGNEYRGESVTYTLRPALGYFYTWRRIDLIFSLNYFYIHDTGAPLYGLGFWIGTGFAFN